MAGKTSFCLLSLLLAAVFLPAQIPDSLLTLFQPPEKTPPTFTVVHEFTYFNAALAIQPAEMPGPDYHVRVRSIEYFGPDSFRVAAWLVTPLVADSVALRPAVVYQHWGEGAKDEFLAEAIALAQKGFVCLLPDAPWNCPGSPYTSFSRHGYDIYRRGVLHVRRGLDLLQAVFPVDPRRVYYVGHSYGAGLGGVLAGVEPRFQAVVLMTGQSSLTRALESSNREDIVQWRQKLPGGAGAWMQRMRAFDPDRYLPFAKALIFLQVARDDESVEARFSEELVKITPEPKRVEYYAAPHALNAAAYRDRVAFLANLAGVKH